MKIEVLETSLRDGVQAEGISLSAEDKRALIALFDDLKLDYIEAGTPFSNPKDKALLCDGAPVSTNCSKLVAFGTTRHKNTLIDDDSALKTLAMSNVGIVSVVGKSSATHIEKVLNASLSDNLKMIYDSIRYLCDRGKEVFFDAEHFFDGYRENPEYAMDTLRVAKNAGATHLILCDTNGAAMPDEFFDLTKKVVKAFKKTVVGVHCHNDTGLAVANTMAAVDAGATHIQGTFLGFGERCGNCNLSTAILNLQLKKGYELVPAEAVAKFTGAARQIAEITNILLMKNMPYVGKSAFSHKGGMHADGVLKYPPAFEHISPEEVGNERRFLLSDISGRASFNKKASEVVPEVRYTPEIIRKLLAELKTKEMQGYQFEGADASLAIFIKKSLGLYNRHFDLVDFSVTSNMPSGSDNSADASVTITVNGRESAARALGNGPVNALDTALRSALEKFYPVISDITLLDYKVRVINSEAATGATVRVLITSSDGHFTWTTVGVSTDIIEASWRALTDSVEYKLSLSKGKE